MMTPTEFRDHVETVVQEGFRMLLVLLVAIAIYLVFVGFAAALECQERPGDEKHYWQYRIIDGQRCWYRGEDKKEKSELHWPKEPTQKKIKDPMFRAEAQVELPAVTWHMARPFDQAKPVFPPLLYDPNDVPDECCWPDLNEFDRRFTGTPQ